MNIISASALGIVPLYNFYTSHDLSIAYEESEQSTFLLFKTLGKIKKIHDQREVKKTRWKLIKSRIKSLVRKETPVTEQDLRNLITQKLHSKLPKFRIIKENLAVAVEISPLTFTANWLKSEPLFHLLLEFTKSKNFALYFSDGFEKDKKYSKIAILSILDSNRVARITKIGTILKEIDNKHFSTFKQITQEVMAEEKQKLHLVETHLGGIKVLAELVGSYFIHPYPEILL
jgi:hypothetical protein